MKNTKKFLLTVCIFSMLIIPITTKLNSVNNNIDIISTIVSEDEDDDYPLWNKYTPHHNSDLS